MKNCTDVSLQKNSIKNYKIYFIKRLVIAIRVWSYYSHSKIQLKGSQATSHMMDILMILVIVVIVNIYKY
nr:MAG TPA: hypothetical protein [Caudoviricetes sp.]